MNKVLKRILLLCSLLLLASCRNQIQKDFLDRITELLDHNHMEGKMTFHNLEEVNYQFILQKDKEVQENLLLNLEMNYYGQSLPLLEATIIHDHVFLKADSFLETGSFFSYQQVADISWDAWNQLKEDHQDSLVLLKDEIAVKEQDLKGSPPPSGEKETQEKKLLTIRKLFLQIPSENFTETENELTLEMRVVELETLFYSLLEEENKEIAGNLPTALADYFTALRQEEDKETEVEVTLQKAKPFLTVQVNRENLLPLQERSMEGIQLRIDFSDRPGEVNTPALQEVVTSGRLQNILTPLHEGHSLTGYSPFVFQQVLEKTATKRADYQFTKQSAKDLLNSYFTLLTEEQYRELEKVLDIDTIDRQFDHLPNWNDSAYWREGEADTFSPDGYPPERFNPVKDSIRKYRDNHTKESAQKTLDQYRHILSREQYLELEELLDIDSLPK